MGVIATAMDAYRTSLAAAPASLTPMPEAFDIDDTPDTDKTYFRLRVADGPQLGAMHGGGTHEFSTNVALEVVWTKDVDAEEIWDTVADDIQNIHDVMLSDSSRSAGVVFVNPLGFSYEERPNSIRGNGRFEFRFRAVMDLS